MVHILDHSGGSMKSITIHGVDVTPDLRSAHVFVGVVGGEGAGKRVIDKLNLRLSGDVPLRCDQIPGCARLCARDRQRECRQPGECSIHGA